MAISLDKVRQILQAEEPDYTRAARLGPEILPHLEQLIRSEDDTLLASKAAYLASQVEDEHVIEVLKVAATHPEAQVRIAAAAGSKTGTNRESILTALLNDRDDGVVKAALAAAGKGAVAAIAPAVQALLKTRSSPILRNLASQVLEGMGEKIREDLSAGEGVGSLERNDNDERSPDSRARGDGVGKLPETLASTVSGESVGDLSKPPPHRRRPPRARST